MAMNAPPDLTATAVKTALLLFALGAFDTASAAKFTITDLGGLGGWAPCPGTCTYTVGFFFDTESYGRSVNDTGQVTGHSYTPDGNDAHAFLGNPTGLVDLGTLGGSSSLGYGINNSGQVTGWSRVPGDGTNHAFIGDVSGLTDLGTLGGDYSAGSAINDPGLVTGVSELANGENRAFVGDASGIIDLGTLGGSYSSGEGINDYGQVTGVSTTSDGAVRAFVGDVHGLTNLGTLGGSTSVGLAINNHGLVTGNSAITGDAGVHAYVGNSAGLIDIGTLGGRDSYGVDINDEGHIVGQADDATGQQRPFFYDGVHMVALESLIIDLDGWSQLERASGISNSGYVTGWGYNANGHSRAFLLTPVPLPLSIWFFSSGFLCLAATGGNRRYRKSRSKFDSNQAAMGAGYAS